MNTKAIYDKAVNPPQPPDPKEEEAKQQAQFLLGAEKANWLQHPITRQLLDFLHAEKDKLMEEVVTLAYGEPEKLKARLHKVATIKEIIEYARRTSN